MKNKAVLGENKPKISGFFPFLNDWGTIGSLVLTLDSTLQNISSEYEIIVVDDGSDLSSKNVLKSLEKAFPKVRVVTHEKNKGYGGAIRSGISEAKYDWIFYTDGDAQYDPREITKLVEKIRPDVDVVNGYKIKRSDPFYRIITGKTYHFVVKTLFNVPIRDTDCDFRLMRKSIFDKVQLKESTGLICTEMIRKISDGGFTFTEVPVNHYWRTSGKSQFFNLVRVGQVIVGLLGLWWRLVIKKEHFVYGNKKNN
ncbi:MAG: glycosyltransferase family 2 protein [Nitrospira sp.]